MQCGFCKHVISFKINVLYHPVPAQYDATVLCSKKKRGRPKKVSAAWNIDDAAPIILLDDSDDDEPSADVAYCVAV